MNLKSTCQLLLHSPRARYSAENFIQISMSAHIYLSFCLSPSHSTSYSFNRVFFFLPRYYSSAGRLERVGQISSLPFLFFFLFFFVTLIIFLSAYGEIFFLIAFSSARERK